MSIHTNCVAAAKRLLDDPDLADAGVERVFTEIDIISLAGLNMELADPSTLTAYMRSVNNVMGNYYKLGKVCRYGPVSPPGTDHQDYMRIAAKVVYAHPETGPSSISTPNGNFGRMMAHNDDSIRPGKKAGSNRDDLIPWGQQGLGVTKATNGGNSAPDREITRLTTELTSAYERIRELQGALKRQRDLRIDTDDPDAILTREKVEELIARRLDER